MKERVHGTLASTPRTLQPREGKKRAFRKQAIVARIKIEIDAQQQSHGNRCPKNNKPFSTVPENHAIQLNGIPVNMANGALIRPSTSETMHHVKAFCEAR